MPFTLLLVALSVSQAQDHEGHGEPTAAPEPPTEATEVSAADLPLPIGVLDRRGASGTAWQPYDAPMYAWHASPGPWDLMLHGNVFAGLDAQGTKRGATELMSVNWVMGMAGREIGAGYLSGRAMFSLEPLTLGADGYPLLLQTGETLDGEPLVDRQHPHDLFMELAAMWQQRLTDRVGAELYLAPAGEPALGPIAFPHRPSAIDDPLAPIGHHWQDATHIAYGVVTAGVFTSRAKLEGSAFHGREPDEFRYDLDLGPLDSYAGRLSWAPSRRWVVQISYGFLHSPEATEPDADVHRFTASASWSRALPGDRRVDALLLATRNLEGETVPDSVATSSLLAEARVAVGGPWVVYGRLSHVVKTAHDFDLHDLPEHEELPLQDAHLGLAWLLDRSEAFDAALGVRGNVAIVPDTLVEPYDTRFPAGFLLYLQVRPSAMRHEAAEHGPVAH